MPASHRDGCFRGPDGFSIYYQYWLPASRPRAIVLVAHGAGEHSSRYAALADFFTARGYLVAALDHPGHGKSDGSYGHIDRFSQYQRALATFREQLNSDFPGLPVILLGHSMGGLISACHLLDHQHDFIACALSGPAIRSDLQPGVVQIITLRLLSVLLPRVGAMQLDANGVSRDPKVVEAYRDDPLVNHGKYSARFVAELFSAMERLQRGAQRITLPLLLMHGEADSMTAPAGSQWLYEAVGSEEKTLKLYPGLYHEIFNEPEREQVLEDLSTWCDARLQAVS